jgi:26S proteasome regulatory subunit N12
MDMTVAALDDYKRHWSQQSVDLARCAALMATLRVHAAGLSLTLPKEAFVAREVLEYAVQLHLRRADHAAMERAVKALRPLYYDYAQTLPESPRAHTLLGVYLLYLLTENRLADLHAELELMGDAARTSRYVRFVVALEQHKMEGRYNKLWAMQRNELPHELFAPYMARLLDTARADIADSLEHAYATLSIAHARQLLGLDTDVTVRNWAMQRGWNSRGDTFVLRDDSAASELPEINALSLIAQSLAYANELERII